MLADPVGCRVAMDGRLSGSEGLSDALRHSSLPSCPEGHPSLVPAPAASVASASLLPPMHPESSGGPRRSAGGMSQHSGSLHAGTPRTPLSAEYAQALQRNSQRLLEAVASSASSGLGGSAENPVPLPEQETLMLPLAAVPGMSPQDRVCAATKAAAEAGQLPPEAEHEGPAPRLRPRATPPKAQDDEAAATGADVADGDGAGADAAAAAAGAGAGEAADPCTCPPYAVKATCGKRPIMEDTYALCPNICELPMPPMTEDFADKLPLRIAVQLATGEPSVEAGAAAAGPTVARAAGPDAGGGAAFGSPLGDTAALEKLHFFGVYDGHGGIQASQHCAARLHHHLSACLREMATEFLGHTPAGGPGEGGDGAEPCDGWQPPVYPEVQFVSVIREGGAPLGGPLGGGDDCLIAVAAAAAAAEAGAGKLASVSSAPEVSPEDEAALRALSRESSSDERRDKGGAAAAAAEAAVAAADAADDAASADGSEGFSMCGLLEGALRAAFLKTDEEFSADGTAGLVGSTAVCALVGTHRVWIANCGDSRAVLCRGGQAVQVTDDHKPEREDEAERVEKAGGQVLYWNGHRVMGVLAMSRAIGDHCLRPYVIPEPEITVFKRHHKDEILLLASDGLWDVMPNQEATDLAMRCIRRARDKGASPKAAARVAATILTKAAVDRGSRDNITVMVIDLSRASAGAGGRAGEDDGADGEGAQQPAAPAARPAGGRLAAAAAAAEAAGATGRRPVPQRIISEQPSVTTGLGLVPGASVVSPPGQQQQQQQVLRQHPAVPAQQPLTSEASITAAPKAAAGPFGRTAASPFVAAPAAEPQEDAEQEEAAAPITAQRQGSTSPFSACNLAPFDGAAAPPGSS